MRRQIEALLTMLMCALAILTTLASLRYLAPSHPYLMGFQVGALFRHPVWFPAHILCGVLTLSLGLLQFSNRLRATRPAVHRAVGYVYVAAVLIGGVAGLRLAPDTSTLLAEGLQEESRMKTVYGIPTAAWGLKPDSNFTPQQFTPVNYSFAMLALAWLMVTAAAFRQALRRDFSSHRAWMIRSYSLTFAAVSVRLLVIPVVMVVHDLSLASNFALSSWILNLVVAEFLIRWSRPRPVAVAAHA